MSSIRDVARLAGVSPATVSRVMNGTARVEDNKKDRVLKAINDLGFVPNEVARSLFRKSARLIGLIIPNLHNPYYAQLAGAIDEAAAKFGYRSFLCEVGWDEKNIKNTLTTLKSMNVDGAVLTVSTPEVERFLGEFPLPVAALDCIETANHVKASVFCDYYMGGRLAMEHLLACGCQKIVCIQASQDTFSARMRYEGYRDVCREKKIPQYVLECDYDFLAGLAMTEKLLKLYPDADGILACNDLVAVSTFKILHKNHIDVPEQVQLVGFDDIHLASLISPELTTIRQPLREMAEKAVSCLVDEREMPASKTIIYPVTLMARETTKRGAS